MQSTAEGLSWKHDEYMMNKRNLNISKLTTDVIMKKPSFF